MYKFLEYQDLPTSLSKTSEEQMKKKTQINRFKQLRFPATGEFAICLFMVIALLFVFKVRSAEANNSCQANGCPQGATNDASICGTVSGFNPTTQCCFASNQGITLVSRCNNFHAPSPFTKESLNSLNPLLLFSSDKEAFYDGDSFSLAGFINRLLQYIFPLAGMVLFVMLVWGGFEMLTGAASKQNTDAGKQRITAAIIGFTLLFVSYWLTQIVEFITGVKILG